MTYSGGRRIHDADSHLMETPDWLRRHADPSVRDHLPLLDLHGMEPIAARDVAEQATGTAAGEGDLLLRKNWAGLGAFDPDDRSRALDLLGFRSQLVFSTYSHLPLLNLPSSPGIGDPALLYAAVRAHNRGMAEFCAQDPRLLAVGWVSLNIPELAVAAAEEAIELGCAAIEVPSYPVGPHSLTHVRLDPMYALLEEAGRPLVFHVGGGGRLANPVFADNGRPKPAAHRAHAPLLPMLTFMGIPAPVEMAVAALVFDGVFEAHPDLRCGVIEQGASWVPSFVRLLDHAFDEFDAGEGGRLTMRPSEYVCRHVRFTPFCYEDVGWLIDQTSPDLYLFSTDYPHDEGGTTPLEQFVAGLEGRPDAELDRFFWRNFEDLMGVALPATVTV